MHLSLATALSLELLKGSPAHRVPGLGVEKLKN